MIVFRFVFIIKIFYCVILCKHVQVVVVVVWIRGTQNKYLLITSIIIGHALIFIYFLAYERMKVIREKFWVFFRNVFEATMVVWFFSYLVTQWHEREGDMEWHLILIKRWRIDWIFSGFMKLLGNLKTLKWFFVRKCVK